VNEDEINEVVTRILDAAGPFDDLTLDLVAALLRQSYAEGYVDAQTDADSDPEEMRVLVERLRLRLPL
jgi:hypothetical protein